MRQHKWYCDGAQESNSSDKSNHDDDDRDEDGEENYVKFEFVGDDEVYEIVYF